MHLTSLSLHPHFLSPKPKPFLFPANPSRRRRPSLFSPSRSHLSPHPRRPSRTHHPMNRRRPLRTLTTSSPGSSRLTAMPSVSVRPRRRISRSTATSTSPNAVSVQNLMAKMVHNGTEAVIVEASHESLSIGKCDEVNFDIAVFTNLRRDHLDFAGTDDEYTAAKAKLFQKMTDPERNSKIINIDDPNAPFVITRGNEDVPVVTYAMENKNAVVHPPKYELSLFETQILVNTPHGILEISSVLLGRHDICNILAAATVGAPLEDIVRGIEEIDEVPGRFELIDEEQAFGVIVGHTRTPDALSRLLDSVRELRPRRIITVIGCPGVGERGKKSLMTKIVTDKSEVTMLTSDYLKHGKNDYYSPLSNGHGLFLHDIRSVAVRCAVAMGDEADMAVVTGKGHEAYEIEGDKKELFDDREGCREALQHVDKLHQAGIDTIEVPWRLPESLMTAHDLVRNL